MNDDADASPPGDERVDLAALAHSIAAELTVALGSPERTAARCARLRGTLHHPLTDCEHRHLAALGELLARQAGTVTLPVAALLEEAAAECRDPWPLLRGMIAASREDVVLRGLACAAGLADAASLAAGDDVVRFLAEQSESESTPLCGPQALPLVGRILRARSRSPSAAVYAVRALFVEGEGAERRLAARILDLGGEPVSRLLQETLLGRDAYACLGYYLDYTRASHLDLARILEGQGPARVASAVAAAEQSCGRALLREIVAELGWARLNLGLEVRPLVGVSLGGSFPFMVAPAEAALLETSAEARRRSELRLVVAQGGTGASCAGAAARDPVERFRAYSLAHAELLVDLLDVTPPTRALVLRILERMDGIVADFVMLFASHTDECPRVADRYRGLRERVIGDLARAGGDAALSPEVTRLVLTFEDPQTPDEVCTVHGLKRYLHQRSLKLAFRLVQAGRGTNRTVDALVASPARILRRMQTVHYIDFDPESGAPATAPALPYPVRTIVDGFSRSLLHGRESFPGVRVFCYGSEVHYFISFGNHPALLRVNYAPPLAGGMIDLEFFGVSKYELGAHPNPSLDALAQLFRRLDFDLRIDATRVSARYDKERALDLGDLCARVECLAGALPYLMDLDWMVGDLALDAEARAEVSRAWAEWLVHWGVLPVEQILGRDRRGILLAIESGPTGEHEVLWNGEGRYRDRFSAALPEGLPGAVQAALAGLGLDALPLASETGRRPLGQLRLENRLLAPLRDAVARGEIGIVPRGFVRQPPGTYQPQHEAEVLAEVLAAGDERLPAAAAVAQALAPVERALRFRTTGAVNGHDVQAADVPLAGESLRVAVLRDPGGIPRLGLFAPGSAFGRARAETTAAWRSNVSFDAARLSLLLRRAGYFTPGAEPAPEAGGEEAAAIREQFRTAPLFPVSPAAAGAHVLTGLRASPGRAVGRALFGTAGRMPAELDGAVLVAEALGPQDSAALYHAAGVVSTGGGVLSHVGLLALQFRKPALIVAGEWEHGPDGRSALRYRGLEYREEEREVAGFRVTVRREIREPEQLLREGDLVVLDADAGTLTALGQDRTVLALHDELRAFGEALRLLRVADDPAEVLRLRGRKLRARHQLVKLLGALTSPLLARHAVRELLAGEAIAGQEESRGERIPLLSALLANAAVSGVARDWLCGTAQELGRRLEAARARAARQIPLLPSVYEVLAARLEVLRVQDALADASATLRAAGLEPPGIGPGAPDVDALALDRLERLRRQLAEALPESGPRDRHVLRQLERLDDVLDTPEAERELVRRARRERGRGDEVARARLSGRHVLWPADGGLEIHPLVGWKAANLAEAGRQEGASIPPWFAITQRAFEEVLRAPVAEAGGGGEARGPEGLGRAIEHVLAGNLGHAEQAARIRALWEKVALPPALVNEVAIAYRRLTQTDPPAPCPEGDADGRFVSVRSSAREEDAESAVRAGEFDTFLFVAGEEQVVQHLRRAWSGLWTERAIHNRAALGLGAGEPGGGVIVQRMVWSRVSGVVVTCNLVEGELLELVVNAGLGLGEGVVSGAVAADHVVVAKPGDGAERPLRVRYVTADKRERVVFDRRAGAGTTRTSTVYHQRLRPALEYLELADLVRLATRLEAAYGHPLDLEFGIEDTRLWLLQVRPVPVLVSAVRDTLEHHPLAGAMTAPGRGGGPP